MKKSIFLLLFLGNFFLALHASVVITGTMANAYLNDRIELKVPHYYIDYKSESFLSFIDERQSFTIKAEIKEPQLVFLTHNEDRLVLFLEPNDSLHIETDLLQFPLVATLTGRAAHNNRLLRQFMQENPAEMNEFNKMKYKIGSLWTTVDFNMDRYMQDLDIPDFKEMLEKRKIAGLALLDDYKTQNPGSITSAFSDYLTAEILYYQAYHLLFYGAIYKNMHHIEPAFFEFLYDVPLQCDMVGSEAYRQFVMALLAFKQRETGQIETPFSDQYGIADQLLSGKSMAFSQSEIIRLALSAERYNEILPIYTLFLQKNSFKEYDDKITELFEKSVKVSPGIMAPAFAAKDYNGKEISLDGFRGKIVYVNFWASWCSACLKKMAIFNDYVYELGQNNVEVVNISIDAHENAWYEALSSQYFQGYNILSPNAPETSIAEHYGVKAVPQYFIIDKYGVFAEKPYANKAEDIKNYLLEMAKK